MFSVFLTDFSKAFDCLSRMFPAAMLNAHMDLKLEQCDLYLLYLSMNDVYL